MALDKSVQGSTDENIVVVLDGLKARLRELGRPEAGGTLLAASWLKALYTAIPWFVLSLLALISPGSGAGRAILGMALVAVPLTVVNVNLPDFQPRWVNQWLIPWGEVLVVVLLILGWQGRSKKAV